MMDYYDKEKLIKRIAQLEGQLRDMDSTIRRGITSKINLSKEIPENLKKEVLDLVWNRK